LDHVQRKLITAELVYVFIEEDRDRVEQLSQEIEKLGKLPNQVKTLVIEGAFEDKLVGSFSSSGAKC
jgi:hypothetical protein